MSSLRTIALAGAVLAGATMAAAAADVGPRHAPFPPAPPPVPVSTPIIESSGWYLRGDVGLSMQTMKPSLEDRRFNPLTVGQFDFQQSKSPFFGVGAGYQWNSWLRTDVTAEYRTESNFTFQDRSCFGTAAGGLAVGTVGAGCTPAQLGNGNIFDNRNFYNGRIASTVLLFNAYLDLGNWNGFSPFIGAGIGYASHQITNLSDFGVASNYVNGARNPGGDTNSGLVPFQDRSQGSVAYALMAGVGYDVSSNVKLELGYRYLNMGRVNGQSLRCANNTCGDFMHYRNIQAHEVRLGLRYMFGAPVHAAAPAVYHPGHVTKRF